MIVTSSASSERISSRARHLTSSELTGDLQTVTSSASSERVSSRARQLTKDHQKPWCLFSSRDTHEGPYKHREPTPSPRQKRLSREPTPSPRQKRLSREPTPSPRQKRLSREPTPSPRQKCLARAKSKHLVAFSSLVFAPRVSFLSPMPHGLLAR